jgi:purine-cytosine permease-like protein
MSGQADNDFAFGPVDAEHRRDALPLLTLAFGWGFLITGLIVGGGLSGGLTFPDLMLATAIGNTINFVIAGLVAYIGYRTGPWWSSAGARGGCADHLLARHHCRRVRLCFRPKL